MNTRNQRLDGLFGVAPVLLAGRGLKLENL